MSVEIIEINPENVEEYGLFCKKSKKNGNGYQNKVKWLKQRLKEGLKYKLLWTSEGYKKLTSRGFIEYIPGQYNWRGIQADNYIVIHCIWVTGRVKNKGYGAMLLNEAIKDAKAQNLNGVAVLTSPKCSGAPKGTIFEKAGFEKVDEMRPYYELYALRLKKKASLPKLNPAKKENLKACGQGVVLLQAHQCPYVEDMVDGLQERADSLEIPFHIKLMKSGKEAQENGISPYGTYGVVFNGEMISYCFPRIVSDVTALIKK